jgi:hypothetical protein
MIAYAKQSKSAEDTANALRWQCRELELSIEGLDEQFKLERAAWIVAHASQLGADVEKALTSSSVVAMKRNALEAQILAEYPFVFFVDVAAKKLELATLELQRSAARTDAGYYKMLFLASLRGFSDMDETPYEPDSMIHDTDLLTLDEINMHFELASQEYELDA